MWDQLVVGAAPGDAITRCALLLRNALSRYGTSDIFAQHREPGILDEVRPLDELSRRVNAARPLIVHISMGSWPVFQAIQRHAPEIIVIYHNFSPPEHYVDHAPNVASDLIQGRWELAQLRERTVRAIAVSEFNAKELEEVGYTDVEVVPPAPDIGRVTRLPPDRAMLARLRTWGPGPLVLTVAQQFPHKRLDRVLAATAVLQQEFVPDARIAIVGVERFPEFSRTLRNLARTLGGHSTHFLGRVADEELAALFTRASVFLLLSEHEGFCVPLVESMAAGVPVVAADRAAMPATVGDAGIVVGDPDDPVLAAALVHRALTDDPLRRLLVGRGVARAKTMSAAVSIERMVEIVRTTAAGASERPA